MNSLGCHLAQQSTPAQVAEALGLKGGVSGYIYDTVPMVLYCWLRYPGNFRSAVEETILLGGDTDTTAAVTGALAGAALGASRIPKEWVDGLAEWPRSSAWIRVLGDRLAAVFHTRSTSLDAVPEPLPLCWPALPLRNAFFMAVVLSHGIRRGLPPY